MEKLTGVGVSPGRAIAKARVMAPAVEPPPEGQTLADDADPSAEAERISTAASTVQAHLQKRADKVGGDARELLAATAQMAVDPALVSAAKKKVTGAGLSGERAVFDAAGEVSAMLKKLGGYMAERTRDVDDVRDRIIAELRGFPPPGIPEDDVPFVLIAHDLAPADTATLDADTVAGLVTAEGGPQSHTAILARSLGIPAIVAVAGAEGIADGAEVYVDGAVGQLDTEPGDEERERVATWQRQLQELQHFDGQGRLADGHRVSLLANIANADDAVHAAQARAEGVGLMRTEFCFLDRATEPSIDEQAEQYRRAFAAFPKAKVVIRTLDAGADKPMPFLTDATEPNPALGVRGFRTTRRAGSVLDNQLAAIARAAAASDADVQVMAPMIATAAEAEDFAGRCHTAGVKTAGVMIETPAAALSTENIFAHAEFVSIGTNDLTQYTMAADRQLGSLADLNNAWQPALLRMINTAVDGARAAGVNGAQRPVGVCGEAAADPALAVVLVGIGVTSLSMTARALGPVAAILGSVTSETARDAARAALDADSADAAEAAARDKVPSLTEFGL